MSSRTTSLARTVTVGCAAIGSIAVGAVAVGAGPANALPIQQPAYTSHDFRHDFFSGDPFPLGYEVVDAATNGTGVTRFSAGALSNSLTRASAGYTVDLEVRWVNFANGASGTTKVGAKATFVTTGRGPVGLSVTGPQFPYLPTFGVVNA